MFNKLKTFKSDFINETEFINDGIMKNGLLSSKTASLYAQKLTYLSDRVTYRINNIEAMGSAIATLSFFILMIAVLLKMWGDEVAGATTLILAVAGLTGGIFIRSKFDEIEEQKHSFNTIDNYPDICVTVLSALKHNVLNAKERELLVDRPFLFLSELQYLADKMNPMENEARLQVFNDKIISRKETLLTLGAG